MGKLGREGNGYVERNFAVYCAGIALYWAEYMALAVSCFAGGAGVFDRGDDYMAVPKKLTYSKGVSLAYGVCAIVSVIYLATELNNIAYYTQAVPARNYILYHLRYEVLVVGTMLIWVIWRTLGGRWSIGRARIVPWLLGGLIFWAMVMLGISLRRLEMLEFLTLYGYMEEANNLNMFLFAILMFLENSASKLERGAAAAENETQCFGAGGTHRDHKSGRGEVLPGARPPCFVQRWGQDRSGADGVASDSSCPR